MRGTLHNALLVCVFALVIGGCGDGDDGTIPPDEADNMLNQVEAVQAAVDDGDCERAEDHAMELISVVNSLPNDVDSEVASELTKAADNLRQLASDPDECTDTGASGVEGVEETDTTQTDTTEADTTAEPTTTETTTEEETTTTEEETTTEEPSPEPQGPAGGGGQGGGNTEGGGNVTPTPDESLEPPSGGVQPGGNAG